MRIRVGASVLATLAALSAGGVPAAAQTGSVTGRALDAASGEGVPAATVFVDGLSGGVLTRPDGRFLLVGIPAGEHTLVAERIGYANERARVSVLPGQVTTTTLNLTGTAVSVPAMVVTATREARSLDEVAASIGVIGRAEIERTHPSHPSEVMGKVPGVWVNVTGGEGHMTAIRQPLTTDPVYLYLEDGVPTRSTGFFNHNALYEINVPQAERVEVMKGPSNALYGSDAVGGVINVQTRAPAQEREMDLTLEGGGNGYARALASASGRLGADAVRLDGNYTRTDGWRSGTGYARWSGTMRWDRALGGLGIKTVATFSSIDQSTAGTSALSRADFETNPTLNYTPISFRKVTALRLSTEVEKRMGRASLTLTPYARSNAMDILPNWSLTYDPAVWETSNRSLGLLAKARWDLPGVDGLAIFGLDLERSPGKHREQAVVPVREGSIFTSYETGASLYDYDVTFHQASPYLHVELEAARGLRLSGGMRLDRLGYDYANRLSTLQEGAHRRPGDAAPVYTAVSPKVGATYQASSALALFAAYRAGFRAPSEGQLFRQGSALNTVGLEPVRARSWEMGVRGTLGGRMRYDLTAYRMTMRNDILAYQLGDGTRETVNAGETLHRGIEIGAGLLLAPGLTVDAAYSVAEHRYESWSPRPDVNLSGNAMQTAPNTVGNVELTFAPTRLRGTEVTLEWNHLGRYWMDAENTHRYDGHDLLTARASWRIRDRMELFGRVHNLTNAHYAELASFAAFRGEELAPGMPRTLFVGVGVR